MKSVEIFASLCVLGACITFLAQEYFGPAIRKAIETVLTKLGT